MFSFLKPLLHLLPAPLRHSTATHSTHEMEQIVYPSHLPVDAYAAFLSLYVRTVDAPNDWLAHHQVKELSIIRTKSHRSSREIVLAKVDASVQEKPETIDYILERELSEPPWEEEESDDNSNPKAHAPGLFRQILERVDSKRSVPEDKPTKSTRSSPMSSTSASSPSLANSTPPLSDYYKFRDVITGIPKSHFPISKTQVLGSFHPHGMNLLDLAIMATLMHRKYMDYTLPRNRCYWHAFAVYAMAYLEFGSSGAAAFKHLQKVHRRSAVAEDGCREPTHAQGHDLSGNGKCMNLNVFAKNVELLRGHYREALTSARQLVVSTKIGATQETSVESQGNEGTQEERRNIDENAPRSAIRPVDDERTRCLVHRVSFTTS